MASQAEKIQQKIPSATCDMCTSDGTRICRNCLRFVCDDCIKIYDTDLCSATKERHIFKELKKILQNKMSADLETLTSQHDASVNEGVVDDRKEWPCSRCTYMNHPDYKICTVCASSRDFISVDQTKPGIRACLHCTFHNKEGTKVCEVCSKTLDLSGPLEETLFGLRSAHRDPFRHRAAEVQYPALNYSMSSQSEQKKKKTALQKDLNAICYSCESDDAIICQNCDRFVCGKCREIYLCSATKGQHVFEITDVEQRSAKGKADEETELGLGPVLG